VRGERHALVCGAGGFIGHHLVARLRDEGYHVHGIDLKHPEFSPTRADEFIIGDLRKPEVCRRVLAFPFLEIYQLAADMGGAGYVFTGDHDAEIMTHSGLINLNILRHLGKNPPPRIFFSSSACVYPRRNQVQQDRIVTAEDSAIPADPDSAYGWEKLFSERLYLAHSRQYGIPVRIARFHNIFGPESAWRGGREKAPTAICRKVAETKEGGSIEIWGDGRQSRTFLYIDECLEGIRRLMASDFSGPLNIGSPEAVAINDLVRMTAEIAGKRLSIRHVPGPLGVNHRTSDNRLIRKILGWQPHSPLRRGMTQTYQWVAAQVQAVQRSGPASGTS